MKCTFWPKTFLQKKAKEDNCKGLKVRFHIQLWDKMNIAYFLVGQVSYSIIRWNEHCIHFLVAYIQIWSWPLWSWPNCCSFALLKENHSSWLKLQEIRPCMRSKMAARRSIILSTIQEARSCQKNMVIQSFSSDFCNGPKYKYWQVFLEAGGLYHGPIDDIKNVEHLLL